MDENNEESKDCFVGRVSWEKWDKKADQSGEKGVSFSGNGSGKSHVVSNWVIRCVLPHRTFRITFGHCPQQRKLRFEDTVSGRQSRPSSLARSGRCSCFFFWRNVRRYAKSCSDEPWVRVQAYVDYSKLHWSRNKKKLVQQTTDVFEKLKSELNKPRLKY